MPSPAGGGAGADAPERGEGAPPEVVGGGGRAMVDALFCSSFSFSFSLPLNRAFFSFFLCPLDESVSSLGAAVAWRCH